MRLLNSATLEIEDFVENTIPDYAILSHTWAPAAEGDVEVLFQDMQTPEKRANSARKAGFVKLETSCEQAAADGFAWLWVDTCCIDKHSSAELSEAINSMYQWYQTAKVCYAYLDDVHANALQSRSRDVMDTPFAKCKWFTRGWTLQELVASKEVIFFSREWIKLGTKSSLHKEISIITGIGSKYLLGADPETASVAHRMSWASKRKTTKTEDMAYSLIGIFGVNMPLLYGEGKRAFLRLQEEIIKSSDDHSIFAWKGDGEFRGLLAEHPREFVESGGYFPFRDWKTTVPYSMTNKGLRIDLPLVNVHDSVGRGIWLACLRCPDPRNHDLSLGIFLKQLSEGGDQYARVQASELSSYDGPSKISTVNVRQKPTIPTTNDVYQKHTFYPRNCPSTDLRDREFYLRWIVNEHFVDGAFARRSILARLSDISEGVYGEDFLEGFRIHRDTNGMIGVLGYEFFNAGFLTSFGVVLGSTPNFGIFAHVASMPTLSSSALEKDVEEFVSVHPQFRVLDPLTSTASLLYLGKRYGVYWVVRVILDRTPVAVPGRKLFYFDVIVHAFSTEEGLDFLEYFSEQQVSEQDAIQLRRMQEELTERELPPRNQKRGFLKWKTKS